jgi:hypothetical protein
MPPSSDRIATIRVPALAVIWPRRISFIGKSFRWFCVAPSTASTPPEVVRATVCRRARMVAGATSRSVRPRSKGLPGQPNRAYPVVMRGHPWEHSGMRCPRQVRPR